MINPFVKHPNGEKKLLVGIGNVLKRDDGAGVYITNHINPHPCITPLTVELSIENYIGKINKLNHDLLILVDCMDFRRSPGYWNILPVEQISGPISNISNTHNITLDKVSELFHSPVFILGIQPQNIQFGEGLTPLVKKTADHIISLINA